MAVVIDKTRPKVPNISESGGKIVISSVFLNTGLEPILPDKDGLYRIWGGAFNCHNGRGDFYPFVDRLKKEFTEPKSTFSERLAAGLVGGECNHPELAIYNGNKAAIMARLDRLDKTRECWAVKKVELDYEAFVNPDGTKAVGCWISILPCGYYGETARKALESKGVNVVVSLRTFSLNTLRPDLTFRREITKPLHWDWVEENGLANASKAATQGYSTESLTRGTVVDQCSSDMVEINFSSVQDLKSNLANEGLSMESLGINVYEIEQMLTITPKETHTAFNF